MPVVTQADVLFKQMSYLTHTHKRAFKGLPRMWKRKQLISIMVISILKYDIGTISSAVHQATSSKHKVTRSASGLVAV